MITDVPQSGNAALATATAMTLKPGEPDQSGARIADFTLQVQAGFPQRQPGLQLRPVRRGVENRG